MKVGTKKKLTLQVSPREAKVVYAALTLLVRLGDTDDAVIRLASEHGISVTSGVMLADYIRQELVREISSD